MCWMAKTRDIQGEILESLRGGLGYIVYRDFANIISLFSTRELALAFWLLVFWRFVYAFF